MAVCLFGSSVLIGALSLMARCWRRAATIPSVDCGRAYTLPFHRNLVTSSHRHSGHLMSVLTMHQYPPLQIKWSANGQFLASCGMDYSVIVWNVSTCHVKQQWTLHTGARQLSC